MKLLDLNGHFFGKTTDTTSRGLSTLEGAQGVAFQCPSCAVGLERGADNGRRFVRGAHYIRVCFSNPRGAAPAPDAFAGGKPRWELVSGTSLEDLTLSPWINCDIPWEDADGVIHPSSCKFHGFVRSGHATPPDGDVESLTLPARHPNMESSTDHTEDRRAPDEEQLLALADAEAKGALTETDRRVEEFETPDPAPAVPSPIIAVVDPQPALGDRVAGDEPIEAEPEVESHVFTVRAKERGFDGIKMREPDEIFPLRLTRGQVPPTWVEEVE